MILTGLSVVMALSTLLLVWLKSIVSSIKILSLQSLLLGIASILLAAKTGIVDMYIIASLTILIKAVFIPFILYSTMRKIDINREVERYVSREISILVATSMVVFSYVINKEIGPMMSTLERQFLPISISMLLIGLYVMITHKKAIMQGIGLIVIENGLFLFAISTTYGMPFLVDVGVFLDVFVTVILISILNFRMNQTFQSISTDWLRRLKG